MSSRNVVSNRLEQASVAADTPSHTRFTTPKPKKKDDKKPFVFGQTQKWGGKSKIQARRRRVTSQSAVLVGSKVQNNVQMSAINTREQTSSLRAEATSTAAQRRADDQRVLSMVGNSFLTPQRSSSGLFLTGKLVRPSAEKPPKTNTNIISQTSTRQSGTSSFGAPGQPQSVSVIGTSYGQRKTAGKTQDTQTFSSRRATTEEQRREAMDVDGVSPLQPRRLFDSTDQTVEAKTDDDREEKEPDGDVHMANNAPLTVFSQGRTLSRRPQQPSVSQTAPPSRSFSNLSISPPRNVSVHQSFSERGPRSTASIGIVSPRSRQANTDLSHSTVQNDHFHVQANTNIIDSAPVTHTVPPIRPPRPPPPSVYHPFQPMTPQRNFRKSSGIAKTAPPRAGMWGKTEEEKEQPEKMDVDLMESPLHLQTVECVKDVSESVVEARNLLQTNLDLESLNLENLAVSDSCPIYTEAQLSQIVTNLQKDMQVNSQKIENVRAKTLTTIVNGQDASAEALGGFHKQLKFVVNKTKNTFLRHRTEIGSLANRIHTAQLAALQANEKIEAQGSVLGTLRDKLDNQLEMTRTRDSEARSARAGLQKQITKLNTENGHLRLVAEEAQKRASAAERRVKEQLGKVEDYQRALEEATKFATEERDRADRGDEAFRELKGAYDNLKDRMDKMEMNFGGLRGTQHKVELLDNKYGQKFESLSVESDASALQIKQNQKRFEALKDDIQSKLKHLDEGFTILNATVDSLGTSHGELQPKVAKLEAESKQAPSGDLSVFRRDQTTVDRQYKSLCAQVDECRSSVQMLTDQIEFVKKQHGDTLTRVGLVELKQSSSNSGPNDNKLDLNSHPDFRNLHGAVADLTKTLKDMSKAFQNLDLRLKELEQSIEDYRAEGAELHENVAMHCDSGIDQIAAEMQMIVGAMKEAVTNFEWDDYFRNNAGKMDQAAAAASQEDWERTGNVENPDEPLHRDEQKVASSEPMVDRYGQIVQETTHTQVLSAQAHVSVDSTVSGAQLVVSTVELNSSNDDRQTDDTRPMEPIVIPRKEAPKPVMNPYPKTPESESSVDVTEERSPDPYLEEENEQVRNAGKYDHRSDFRIQTEGRRS